MIATPATAAAAPLPTTLTALATPAPMMEAHPIPPLPQVAAATANDGRQHADKVATTVTDALAMPLTAHHPQRLRGGGSSVASLAVQVAAGSVVQASIGRPDAAAHQGMGSTGDAGDGSSDTKSRSTRRRSRSGAGSVHGGGGAASVVPAQAAPAVLAWAMGGAANANAQRRATGAGWDRKQGRLA